MFTPIIISMGLNKRRNALQTVCFDDGGVRLHEKLERVLTRLGS